MDVIFPAEHKYSASCIMILRITTAMTKLNTMTNVAENADGKSGLGKHLGCEFCKPPYVGLQGLCDVKCNEKTEYPNEVRTTCRKIHSASIVDKMVGGYHAHNSTKVQWTSENLETDRFTIKMCSQQFQLIKENQQCESNNIMYGEGFTLSECAMKCASDQQCLAFLYGKKAKQGACLKETTISAECKEGFVMDNNYDYYKTYCNYDY